MYKLDLLVKSSLWGCIVNEHCVIINEPPCRSTTKRLVFIFETQIKIFLMIIYRFLSISISIFIKTSK